MTGIYFNFFNSNSFDYLEIKSEEEKKIDDQQKLEESVIGPKYSLDLSEKAFESIDVNNCNWPQVEMLLNKSSSLPGEMQKEILTELFYEALSNKQYGAFQRLLEINKTTTFVTLFDRYRFLDILDFSPFCTITLLNELSSQNLIGDRLLDKNLTKQFVNKIITNPDKCFLLQNPFIVKIIKNNFNVNLQASEESFSALITESMMRHLLGDHLVLRIKEKQQSSTFLHFLMVSLQGLQSNDNEVSLLVEQCQYAAQIALRLEAVSLLSASKQKSLALECIADDILMAISKLSPMTSSLILPWGWNGQEEQMMLLEITIKDLSDKTLSLLVYDANRQTTITEYQIPYDKYSDRQFFAMLFEPFAFDCLGNGYSENDGNLMLRPYRVRSGVSRYSEKYLVSDTGYCFRSFEALLERNLGKNKARELFFSLQCHTLNCYVENIKYFTTFYKALSSVLFGLSKAELSVNFPVHRIAYVLLKRLADSVNSKKIAEDLEQLKRVVGLLNQFVEQTSITNILKPIPTKKEICKREVVIHECLPSILQVKLLENEDISTFPIIPKGIDANCLSVDLLLENIEEIINFLNQLKQNNFFPPEFAVRYAAHQLAALSTLILKQVNRVEESPLISSMKEAPQETALIIEKAAELATLLYSTSVLNRANVISVHLSLLALWHLACIVDESNGLKKLRSLKEYSLEHLDPLFHVEQIKHFSLSKICSYQSYVDKKTLLSYLPREKVCFSSLFDPNNYFKKEKELLGRLDENVIRYIESSIPEKDELSDELKNFYDKYYTVFISSIYEQKPNSQILREYQAFGNFISKNKAIPKYFHTIRDLTFKSFWILTNTIVEKKEFDPGLYDLIELKKEKKSDYSELLYKPINEAEKLVLKASTIEVMKNLEKKNFLLQEFGFQDEIGSEDLFFGAPIAENKIFSHVHPNKQFFTSLNSYFSNSYAYEYDSLSLYALLDTYECKKEKLKDLSHQQFFAFHLKQGTALHKELSNPKSSFASELLSFLSNTIAYFERKHLAGLDSHMCMQAILFLLEQKIFALHLVDHYQISLKNQDSLDLIRVKIRSIANKKSKFVEQLQLLLLLSYEGKEGEVDESEVIDIIKAQLNLAYLRVQRLLSTQVQPILREESARVVVSRAFPILNYLKNHEELRNKLILEFLQVYKIDSKNSKTWDDKGSGIFTCTGEDGVLEINVLTGSIRLNGIESVQTPLECLLDVYYMDAIGVELSFAQQYETYVEGYDSTGKVRVDFVDDMGFKTISRILKEFPGKKGWYQFLTSFAFSQMPKDFTNRKLHAWQLVSEKSTHILFCEPNTRDIVYQMSGDGSYIGNDLTRAYEWDEIRFLQFFDPDVYLWQEKTDRSDPHQILVFPNLSCVEEGNPLQFEKKQERWIVTDYPHLCLSSTQEIKQIRAYKKFLILEDGKGLQKAIIPHKGVCHLLDMENQILAPKNVFGAILAASIAVTSAIDTEDYLYVLQLLNRSYSFGEYSKEELELLVQIVNLSTDKNSSSPELDAICLYCAWIIDDNGKRNPQANQEMLKPEELQALSLRYMQRESLIPIQLRLSTHLSSLEIVRWPVIEEAIVGSNNQKKMKKYPKGPMGIFSIDKSVYGIFTKVEKTPFIYIKSRPSENLSTNFYYLFEKAKSLKAEEREQVQELVAAMQYDRERPNPAIRICLEARLSMSEGDSSKVIQDLCKAVEDAIIKCNKNELTTQDIQNINRLLPEAYEKIPQIVCASFYSKHKSWVSDLEKIYLKASQYEQSLPPQQKPIRDYTYQTQLNDDFFENIYREYFVSQTKILNHEMSDFEFPVGSQVDDFFLDYEIGFEKNNTTIERKLKNQDNVEEQLRQLENEITQQKKSDESKLELLNNEIIEFINSHSDAKGALIEQLKQLSFQKQKIDFKKLFLFSSKDLYTNMTTLTEERHIVALHNLIGDGFYLQTVVQKHERLLSALKVRAKSEVRSAAFAFELSRKRCYDINKDPNAYAYLVFEARAGVLLYPYQVDGLNQMISDGEFQNIVIQCLQGGGKTFAWGPIAAFLKADGYHLSIHVAPTETYATNLMDMSKSSQHIFGQREHTFKFEDSSKYFTVKYLGWVRDLMVNAIRNREYITVTKETLLSLLTKYDKDQYDQDCLKEPLDLLEEILGLMRNRALVTLDEEQEVHDKKKELCMPIGTPHSPSQEEVEVVSRLLSCASKSDLLDIENNTHPLQVDKQWESLTKHIVSKLLTQSPWKEFVQSSNENEKIITDYFLGAVEELPTLLDFPKVATSAILIHEMLAEKWLKERLLRYVNEHMGFSLDEKQLRIAIPYSSNMKPLERSEFSDLYVMIMNTFICYRVNGLTVAQVKHFIFKAQELAWDEMVKNLELDSNFVIDQSDTVIEFRQATGVDLFAIDLDDSGLVEQIGKSLRHTSSVDLLFRYVKDEVISRVELFDCQVSSNGHDITSMCKAFVGYSGSVDDPFIIPINTRLILESGTNGKTVDLFVRKGHDIEIVLSQPNALLNLLLTHELRDRIRVLIDKYFFRGVANIEVARGIAAVLIKAQSKIRGVLFFDPQNNLCCLLVKNNKILKLTGTTPEIIASETGLELDEHFTYLDQQHISAVNIKQAPDTIAFLSINEITLIEEICQGCRRLRELDLEQNIIPVVGENELERIRTKLNKENIERRDLISLAVLNQKDQQDYLLVCIQKMVSLVKQAAKDTSYNIHDRQNKKSLFDNNRHLFVVKTAIDLYVEFAKKKIEVKTEEFLESLKKKLLSGLDFDEERLKKVDKTLDGVILKHLPFLPSMVRAKNGRNQDSTIVHQKISENVNLHMKEVEVERIQDSVSSKEPLNLFVPLSDSLFTSPSRFLKVTPFTNKNGCIFNKSTMEKSKDIAPSELWSLSEVFSINATTYAPKLFSDQLLVSSNFALTFHGKVSLLPPFRKQLRNMLLVYDEAKINKWSLVLISIEDAVAFANSKLQIPKDKKIWLFRANGKAVHTNELCDIDENKEIMNLFMQAFIFSGNIEILEGVRWHKLFCDWLDVKHARSSAIYFLEQKVEKSLPVNYLQSNVYKALHSKDNDVLEKVSNVDDLFDFNKTKVGDLNKEFADLICGAGYVDIDDIDEDDRAPIIKFEIIDEDEKTIRKFESLIKEGRKLPLVPINSQIENYNKFIEKGGRELSDNNSEYIKSMAIKYLGGNVKRPDIYKLIHTFRQLLEELELRLLNPPIYRMKRNFTKEIKRLLLDEKICNIICMDNKDVYNYEQVAFEHTISTQVKDLDGHLIEDSHLFKETKEYILAGVFDGHGDKKIVSSYAADYFKKNFLQILAYVGSDEKLEKEEKIFFAFQECVHAIHESEELYQLRKEQDNLSGGSTLVVALVDKLNGRVYTVTLGDSQAFVYRQVEEELVRIPLSPVRSWSSTTDQKWGSLLSIDKKAIQMLKEENRFYWKGCSSIEPSRSLGDEMMPAVSQKPKITSFSLRPNDVIVVASDGVWDRYKKSDEKEFKEIVVSKNSINIARDITDYIRKVNGEYLDDTTAIAIKIKA